MFLIVILALVLRADFTTSIAWAPILILALLAFFLARYLSTEYTMDDEYLRAWRILGGQKIPLSSVRQIEFRSMRDLAPSGFFGAWGWHGRMWSPQIGRFDAIQTESAGILVTGGEHPLFVSPRNATTFARELSRRVRSYTGPLPVDAGAPAPA